MSEIAAIYRQSKKKNDINWFTEYIARPQGAVFVYLLRGTPITPNQVTLISTVICAGAGAMFALLPGHLWLILAVVVFHLSFVLDCVDGMLARHKKIASPLGHLWDFLNDEIKALLLYGCVTIRMWQDSGEDPRYLLIGMAGLFCIANGIAMTAFMRRPEYGAKAITADGQPAEMAKRRGPIGFAIGGVEWAARVVVHYPSYIWLCAAVNRIDIYFWAYTAVNALYLARTFLQILFRVGRFTRPENVFGGADPGP